MQTFDKIRLFFNSKMSRAHHSWFETTMQELATTTRNAYHRHGEMLLSFLAMMIILRIVYAIFQQCSWNHLRFRLSHALEAKKVAPTFTSEHVRSLFVNQGVHVPTNDPTHSHAASAGGRTAAVLHMRQFCLSLGLPEYCVSQSRRDQKSQKLGTRLMFWAKDVDKKVINDKEEGVKTLVDVDYYLDDMSDYLTGESNPVVLSTINPTKVAQSSGESTYYFNDSNELCMQIVGGGSFTHKLWDYTPDVLVTHKKLFGIIYQTTVFNVTKRPMGDLKTLILLSPLGTWHGLWALLLNAVAPGISLKRFEPASNGWVHITTSTPAGIIHSLGETNTHQEATFTAQEFETVILSGKMSKHDPGPSTLGMWVEHDNVKALIAAAYYRANLPRKAAYSTSVDRGVQHISSNVKHYDGDEKHTVQAFMTPVVQGACYAHTNTKGNSKWGVKARITDLAKQPTVMSAFPTECCQEFCDLMMAKGQITQVEFDDVFDAQSRPTQRVLLEEGKMAGPAVDGTVRSFLKKEPVQGIKDPRVISTIPAATKLDYSYYMRAVGKRLKTYEWYAFKTPVEVADRIAEMLPGCTYALEGDFSRMDGNVDENVRTCLEQNLLKRWFPNDPYVLELHSRQFNQAGIISGHAYEGGYARCSGSPETSAFNTILTALVVYLKNRMLDFSPTESFARIGIVGGDDSLVPGLPGIDKDLDARKFKSAARCYGQTLTSDLKTIGQPVTMLSRIFGEAWYGNPSSMCSPLRTLAKVHATANMPTGVTPAMKCFDKATSLLTTDSNTPIIGKLACKMLTSGVPIPDRFKDCSQPHWLQFDTSWPNTPGDWMQEVIEHELPGFEYEHFEKWLMTGDPMRPPVCFVVVAGPGKVDVMVDGEFVPAIKKTVSATESVKSQASSSKRGKRGKKPLKAKTSLGRKQE